MSHAVVNFPFPVRTCKKRKRMPGTNNDRSPEIKKCSMLNENTEMASIFQHFKFMNVWGVWGQNDFAGSWIPIPVRYPELGNDSYQRVGASYFLKYFYFKGYIAQYANCISPIRWRLRLIRISEDVQFKDPEDIRESGGYLSLANQYNLVNQYISRFYRNGRLVNDTMTVGKRADHFQKNFYFGMKGDGTDLNYSSKVIASGLIGQTSEAKWMTIKEGATLAQGYSLNGAGMNSTGYAKDYKHALTPINVRVLVNDNIRVDLINQVSSGETIQTWRTRYWVVLETDQVNGVIMHNATTGSFPYITAVDRVATEGAPNAAEYPCFEISIQTIQYFTDD